MVTNATARFSNRVENYIKYRPTYPDAVYDFFAAELGVTAATVVADIGAGTGISAEPLLRRGNTVYAVEPNADMRAAAERLLAAFPTFISVNGAAEATTLADAGVDFILCAQAFHWFDPAGCRREFSRIMRDNGYVVLMWNNHNHTSTPFHIDYETLLRTHSIDYDAVNHRDVGRTARAAFFGATPYEEKFFRHDRPLDWDALRGLLLSSSYMPPLSDPRSVPMLAALRELFDRHAVDGRVTMQYETQVYFGRLH